MSCGGKCALGPVGVRMESRLIANSLPVGAATPFAPARADRFSLTIAVRISAAVDGDVVYAGPVVNGAIAPLVVLTAQNGWATVTYATHGDVVRQAWALDNAISGGDMSLSCAWECYPREGG